MPDANGILTGDVLDARGEMQAIEPGPDEAPLFAGERHG